MAPTNDTETMRRPLSHPLVRLCPDGLVEPSGPVIVRTVAARGSRRLLKGARPGTASPPLGRRGGHLDACRLPGRQATPWSGAAHRGEAGTTTTIRTAPHRTLPRSPRSTVSCRMTYPLGRYGKPSNSACVAGRQMDGGGPIRLPQLTHDVLAGVDVRRKVVREPDQRHRRPGGAFLESGVGLHSRMLRGNTPGGVMVTSWAGQGSNLQPTDYESAALTD